MTSPSRAGSIRCSLAAAFHFDQINLTPVAIYNGSFSFTGSATGSDFADYLLGLPSAYSQGDSNKFYLRNHYLGIYAQDSWRVKPNLTFNYGLRWDMLPAWREKLNQLQTLDLGEQSVVYPGAPRGLVFPGRSRHSRPRWLPPSTPTSRPALASPTPRTFRTACWAKYSALPAALASAPDSAMFYTAFEGLSAGIMSANPPYGYDYTSLAPPTFANPFVNASSGASVLQPFPSLIPPHGASTSNPNNSVNWAQYDPITGVPSFYHGNVPPYTESYTLSLERQLTTNTILSVGYVGNQAHHQLVLISANPGNPATCLSVSQPYQVAPGSATCGPFGEGGTYVTAAGETIQRTRGLYSSAFVAITCQ